MFFIIFDRVPPAIQIRELQELLESLSLLDILYVTIYSFKQFVFNCFMILIITIK